MSNFTHLHVHSHYSLLDGLGKTELLLQKVKELGMDSMGLTDHGVMYGIVDFIRKAKDFGIKPIVGVEAYLAPNGHKNKRGKIDASPRHVTLLAQNFTGYQNLIQLTTKAHLQGYYYKPRIDYKLLKKHSEGLIVLSGCLNGDAARAIAENRMDDAKKIIEWYISVIGRDRFYLEVQNHPTIPEQKVVNEALVTLGQKYSLPMVATCDSHYINEDDAEAQDVLLCVQTGKVVQDTDRMSMLGEDYSLKSSQEMNRVWSDLPEAVENTQRIAEQCTVELEFGVNRLPHYPLPPRSKESKATGEYTADEYLRELCEKSLLKTYEKEKQEEATKRLDYELSVIGKTGYASYFLIVADFVNEAKRRGILVGPGRGSAAGSIVSYLLSITGLDPLHYNLLFERFLNPERVSMPDIDLDFADNRRDEVIEYVSEKYGKEHVAQIITFGTMAARAAVRDAGRALGFPYSFCDKIAKAIPMFTNFEEALQQSAELKEMYTSDPQVKKLIDTAKKLEGVCRHASKHAAGVVITEEPLTDHVPLQFSSTSNDDSAVVVTQYAMNDVESLGLLKMDFLGLKNLTIINDAVERVAARHKIKVDLDNLPLDDEKTYAMLQEGQTTGVFQLESSGMKRWLKQLKPTEFEDIISMVALYRPGPMDSIPDFVASKHGKRTITYLHPLLKPILEKTYGVIVTQDQVLLIAREFAGFSYAEADILRKAVGKKIKKLLDEQREKFVHGAVKNKGIDIATAKKVWDFIEPFARYGFNRAHAACYAMIAYQTAYLKANYPADFMAALLTSDEGNIDRQAIEVAEAVSLGIKILAPDINESDYRFTVVSDEDGNDAIRFGLGAVKNVGHNAAEAIIKERGNGGRFEDIFDVFRRINSKDFNRKSAESLAQAGAFDCVTERGLLLANVDKLLEFSRALHRKMDVGQKGLFGESTVELEAPRITLIEAEEASKDDRLAWEKELLGLYLSEHPLSDMQKELQTMATPLNEVDTSFVGQKSMRVAGVVTRITKIMTKKQQAMMFVQIEDLLGKVEILVFPNLLETTQEIWIDGAKVLVEGKLSDKDGEAKILADSVWLITKDSLKSLKKSLKPMGSVRAKIDDIETADRLVVFLHNSLTREQLQQVKVILDQHKVPAGGIVVELHIPQNGSTKAIAATFNVPRQQVVIDALTKVVGTRSLKYL